MDQQTPHKHGKKLTREVMAANPLIGLLARQRVKQIKEGRPPRETSR